MRLSRRPRHKPILFTGTVKGQPYAVYYSGSFFGAFEANSDRVVIAGRDRTAELVRRGWIDVDDDRG